MAEQTGEKLVSARFSNSRSRATCTQFATRSSYDIKKQSCGKQKNFNLTIPYNFFV